MFLELSSSIIYSLPKSYICMYIFSNFLFMHLYTLFSTPLLSTPHYLSSILCCCCWCIWVLELQSMNHDAKYGYPYPPPQGAYPPGQPPIMAPPQYAAPPPPQPKRELGFLEGCLAALCCCCFLDECCCDPSIILVT